MVLYYPHKVTDNIVRFDAPQRLMMAITEKLENINFEKN